MSNAIDRLEELEGNVSVHILTPDWRAKDFREWSPATAAYIAACLNASKPLLAVVRIAERINADLSANGDNIITDNDKEALRLALATLKEMTL